MHMYLAHAATAAQQLCADQYEACWRWASEGRCAELQAFMNTDCAASCSGCDPALSDPCNAVLDAVGAGAIESTFRRVAELSELKPSILSEDPFIIQLDAFAEVAEAATLAGIAEDLGFGASGSSCSFKSACNSSALSCIPVEGGECWAQPEMRRLEARMLRVLSLPAANAEPLRFFRYDEGETFTRHHDAAGQAMPAHTPGGPRVWTLYVFLAAPERGGAFAFPQLNLSVAPQPGRAILWPHLRDDDLITPDERTEHEGAPVIHGQKLGVNLHGHRNNLRTRVLAGCATPAGADGEDGMGNAPQPAALTVQHTFPYERVAASTPLHDLAGLHAVTAIPRLLASGAQATAAAADGTTPLHLASGRGLEEAVSALLEAGAAVDAADGLGATPLHHAARQGRAATARRLHAAGATLEATAGAGGLTPLHLAARHGQPHVAHMLLEAGASVGAVGSKARVTPLHLAARHGHVAVSRALVEAGGGLGAADVNGARPLHMAAAEGHAAVVAVLLAAGADVDAAGARGITALHLAAGLGRLDVAQALVQAQAHVTVADAAGRTPFDYARRSQHAAELLRILQGQQGATRTTGTARHRAPIRPAQREEL